MVYTEELEQYPSLIGDLWAFRPQLTLEHVGQSLRANDDALFTLDHVGQSLRAHGDALQKHSLLVYFLKEVS